MIKTPITEEIFLGFPFLEAFRPRSRTLTSLKKVMTKRIAESLSISASVVIYIFFAMAFGLPSIRSMSRGQRTLATTILGSAAGATTLPSSTLYAATRPLSFYQPTNQNKRDIGIQRHSKRTQFPLMALRAGGHFRELSSPKIIPGVDRWELEHHEALELYEQLRNCSDTYISSQVHSALNTLSDALRLYGPHQLFSSFNGGKDAVVIMHLLRAVTAKYSQEKGEIFRPNFIYFKVENEFPEILEYIGECERRYHMNLKRYDAGIKDGLREHIQSLGPNAVPAFVLGTRKGDPNCGEQQTFSPSSAWMPAFMRVNPILTWNYGHVWHFLRTFNLPYCRLYDQGYTSLGKQTDTRPNPMLRKSVAQLYTTTSSPTSKVSPPPSIQLENAHPESHSDEYWPAFMLSDWSQERAGRGIVDSVASNEIECKSTPDGMIDSDSQYKDGAALIIIGDEILNGMTAESNLQVTSKALGEIGIALKRVSVVSDDVDEIAAEIKNFSQKYSIVITSGGIGPTHDDVTLKSVAKALGQDMTLNSEMMKHLEAVHSLSKDAANEMSDSVKRLAVLPELCRLRFPPQTVPNTTADGKAASPVWPVMQVENVFVLPGVPTYFKSKIDLIVKHFIAPRATMKRRRIVLDLDEMKIVKALDGIVSRHSQAKFGSYPFVNHPEYKTIVTVEASTDEIVDAAVSSMLDTLPFQSVLRVER